MTAKGPPEDMTNRDILAIVAMHALLQGEKGKLLTVEQTAIVAYGAADEMIKKSQGNNG